MDDSLVQPDATKIKRLRLGIGLSQGELAKAAKVSKDTIWRWENGLVAQRTYLRAVAEVLGVKVESLINVNKDSACEASDDPSAESSLKNASSERKTAPFTLRPDFILRPDLTRQLETCIQKDSGAALVILAGDGGVGKTFLAQEYACRHSPDYGRIMWIDVRDRGGRSTSVAELILEQLGDSSATVTDSERGLQRIVSLLQWETERILFVLDNADDPDEALAGFIDGLASIPHCWVLVTTRRQWFRLSLKAQQINVGSFKVKEAVDLLKRLLRGSRRVNNESGLRNVAKHERCIPLLVYLAASYLHRTGTSLSDYVRGPGSFEQIWHKLSLSEQALFLACSVCSATGFDAKAVAGTMNVSTDEVIFGLRQLHAWSLVAAASNLRYTLHPVPRDNARKEKEFTDTAIRHADWVLNQLSDNPYNITIMPSIDQEVIAAVEDMATIGDFSRFVGLCSAAWVHWYHRGPWQFADGVLMRAVDWARHCENDAALSSMLFARSNLLRRLGDSAAALRLLNEKQNIDAFRGALADRAAALTDAGVIYCSYLQIDKARIKLEEALRLLEDEPAPADHSLSVTLHEIASMERQAGNYDVALGYLRRGLALAERSRDIPELASTLRHIGHVQADLGNHRGAMSFFNQALAITISHNLFAQTAATLCLKGHSQLESSEEDEAENCYEESLRLSRNMGFESSAAETLLGLAKLRLRGKRYDEAKALVDEALAIYSRTRQIDRIAACKILLATLRKKTPKIRTI